MQRGECGEVCGICYARQVSVPVRIERNALARVRAAPAEIGRVQELSACRAEPCDKGIIAAAQGSLRRVDVGKIRRACEARDVGAAARVNGDAEA